MGVGEKALLFLAILIPAIILCLLLDRFLWRRTPTREEEAQREQERREWDERLANPRYDEIEARVGFPIPCSLREIYDAPGFLDLELFQVPFDGPDAGSGYWEVFQFQPLDSEALTKIGNDQATTWLQFAEDVRGDFYFALPLELCTEDDGPLYAISEGEEPEKIADSLRDFWARRQPLT